MENTDKEEKNFLRLMEGNDGISGSMAKCSITINEKRYNFMQMIKFEAKMEKTVTEIPVLGKTGKAHKSTGWKGTWTGTAHYNQSIIRKLLCEFKDSGTETPFTIEITNNDPTTGAGSQTIVLENCLTSGGILTKFDASAEYLDEEISGTFDDFRIGAEFNILTGMIVEEVQKG